MRGNNQMIDLFGKEIKHMNDALKVTLDPGKVSLAMAEKGYTITSLAEAIGKSRVMVNYWLNARSLNPRQAGAIAKALGVSVKDLI